MIINQALDWARESIKKTSRSPQLDAEVLLSFILKEDKAWLYSNPEYSVTKLQEQKFKNLIKKRSNRWPVAYLIGHKEFYGLDFKVTRNVLIPRPESELLVELALQRIKNVVDVGTGGGNIIISLAKNIKKKKIKFYATDISQKALKIARQNARTHKVLSKIKFLQGDLLTPLLKTNNYKLQTTLILANLPYLTKAQMKNPEFKHEPRLALKSGKDGLDHYQRFFKQLSSFCHPGLDPGSSARFSAMPAGRRLEGRNDITILIEHDPAQKTKLTKLISHHIPQTKITSHKDLSHRPRVLEIKI